MSASGNMTGVHIAALNREDSVFRLFGEMADRPVGFDRNVAFDPPRITSVISYVADLYEITLWSLESRSRVKHLAQARALVVYCVRTLRPDLSFEQIGRGLGARDCWSIRKAFLRGVQLRRDNDDFNAQAEEVIEYFRRRA